MDVETFRKKVTEEAGPPLGLFTASQVGHFALTGDEIFAASARPTDNEVYRAPANLEPLGNNSGYRISVGSFVVGTTGDGHRFTINGKTASKVK